MHDHSVPVRDFTSAYDRSLANERRIYEHDLTVHALPSIFHYWSHRHLRPKLLPYGIAHVNDIFRTYLLEQCRRHPNEPKRFVSLASGNCDLELELASFLRGAACGDFVIDCVDLNPVMLERGRHAANSASLSEYFTFIEADLNEWNPALNYNAAIACQSLHHVINLENLFAETRRALLPGGCLIMSDMIGRNGHRRWPEALRIVEEYWRKLPPSYRFNRNLGAYQETFEDWDCSAESFEGVRSQDILPLLLQAFHFALFLPFGNIIDPFVDRSFGLNFDPDREWDRTFIDEIHHRDEEEIASGRIKPTHMLAVVTSEPQPNPVLIGHLTPQFCIRPPGLVQPFGDTGQGDPSPPDPYEWQAWPLDVREELAATARRCEEAVREAKKHAERALHIDIELIDRTRWALALAAEVADSAARLAHLNRELEERTEWAFRIQGELEDRSEQALILQQERDARTQWALKLQDELDEVRQQIPRLNAELDRKTAENRRLELELRQYLHNPLRYIMRVAKGIGRRIIGIVLRRETPNQVARQSGH